jgi:predicted nucleic acid-binding protein
MILVDTSVWIDYLRAGDNELAALLDGSRVLMHPFIIGEITCGSLRNRTEILSLLKELPRIAVATDDEVWFFIERHKLMNRGIGYIDAHLLASVTLEGSARLWTRDKRLHEVGASLALVHC